MKRLLVLSCLLLQGSNFLIGAAMGDGQPAEVSLVNPQEIMIKPKRDSHFRLRCGAGIQSLLLQGENDNGSLSVMFKGNGIEQVPLKENPIPALQSFVGQRSSLSFPGGLLMHLNSPAGRIAAIKLSEERFGGVGRVALEEGS